MNLNGTLIFRHNLTWVYEGVVVETIQLLNLDIKGWLVLAGEGLCLDVPGVEVPVEPRHVAAAEAELARGVATARVQAPAAPRRVQTSTLNMNIIIRYILISTPTFGVCLSEQAVQLLPLPEHLEAGGAVPAVCLGPAGHQPGSVEDAEEAAAQPRALRPEGLQQAVPHHGEQQLRAPAGQHLARVPALVQVREVEDGDIVPTLNYCQANVNLDIQYIY